MLGPTAFGRVPGFTANIFPKDSIPFLGLTANIGLCLFLFLVGLEIDGSVIKRNAKKAICKDARISLLILSTHKNLSAVSVVGLILPFGFGAALSIPLYNNFMDPSVNFSHFLLFNGVAHAITAYVISSHESETD